MVSACDTCRNPGQCCSGFPLVGIRGDDVESQLRTIRTGMSKATGMPCNMGNSPEGGYTHVLTGLPFKPLYFVVQKPATANSPAIGNWRFWCTKLSRDGRCTIYEDRPALCRHYEPGSDRLCAEYDAIAAARATPKADEAQAKDRAE